MDMDLSNVNGWSWAQPDYTGKEITVWAPRQKPEPGNYQHFRPPNTPTLKDSDKGNYQSIQNVSKLDIQIFRNYLTSKFSTAV